MQSKVCPITVENSRSNIVERVHRTLGDMIRVEDFENVLNPMREVDVLLSSCAWALRATVSGVTHRSPAQLAFNHDMIMQIAIENDWKQVLQKKEIRLLKNNALENEKRNDHQCRVGDFIK